VEAEKAADNGDSKTLYRIVKELSGRLTQKIPINDVDGTPLKSTVKLMERAFPSHSQLSRARIYSSLWRSSRR